MSLFGEVASLAGAQVQVHHSVMSWGAIFNIFHDIMNEEPLRFPFIGDPSCIVMTPYKMFKKKMCVPEKPFLIMLGRGVCAIITPKRLHPLYQ